MQLGARWRVGDPPHRSVPSELYGAIRAQEARYPEASAWTLTWLESRPRCVLDDLVLVTINAAGAITHEQSSEGVYSGDTDDEDWTDDDDWLE